ncbi:hypothetical protein BH012_09810 [Salmonella enterica]|nr:hypothetical protein [Salmonella enterica]EAX6601616.1 hypothetical protein [Salmonella enterica]
MINTYYLKQQAEMESLFGQKSNQHKRTVSSQQLVWLLTQNKNINSLSSCFITLCLLTLTRSSEMITSRWSDINFDNKIWSLSDGHQIPLSPQAISVLSRLRALEQHAVFLFPSTYQLGQAILLEKMATALRQLSDGDLILNDFRVVACSMMKKAKFEEDLMKSVFFHTPYFPPECRVEIMNWWGNTVCSMVTKTRNVGCQIQTDDSLAGLLMQSSTLIEINPEE